MTSSLAIRASCATGLDDVGRRAVALPAPTSRQPVLGMGAAHPVDDDDDLGGRVVEIGDRLLDDGPHDALLQPGVGRRRRPDGLEVLGQGGEGDRLEVGRARRGGVVIGDAPLDLGDARQRAVPARLQLARDEAVLRDRRRRTGGTPGRRRSAPPRGRAAGPRAPGRAARRPAPRPPAPPRWRRAGRRRAAPPRRRHRRAGRRRRCSSARRSRAGRGGRRSAGCCASRRCTGRSASGRSGGSAAAPRAARRRAWARRDCRRVGTLSLTILRIASARSQST